MSIAHQRNQIPSEDHDWISRVGSAAEILLLLDKAYHISPPRQASALNTIDDL